MIIMDSREDDKLKKYFGEEEFTVEALPVGDYFLKDKNIIIERKTMADFIGSYITNHLQEQLENAEENFEVHYLFISGHYNYLSLQHTPYKHITAKSVNKMKIHLLYSFPGLRIVEFDNDKQLIEGVIEMQNYTGSARRKELIRRQQTGEDVHLSVLMSFKGISLRKAKAISGKYNSIHKLISGLEKCQSKADFLVPEVNKSDFTRLKAYFGGV